jgi:hypothetical protein
MQRCAEALAEFLLDAIVCALRLHIQVHTDQDNAGQEQGAAEEPEQKLAEFLHWGKLRSARLKKR